MSNGKIHEGIVKFYNSDERWGLIVSNDIINPITEKPRSIFFGPDALRLTKKVVIALQKQRKVKFELDDVRVRRAKAVYLRK